MFPPGEICWAHSSPGAARAGPAGLGQGAPTACRCRWPSAQLGAQRAPAPGRTAMLLGGSHRRGPRHPPPTNHGSRPGSRRNSAPGVIPRLQPDSPQTCLQGHPEPRSSSRHRSTPGTGSAGGQSRPRLSVAIEAGGEKRPSAAGGNTVRVSPRTVRGSEAASSSARSPGLAQKSPSVTFSPHRKGRKTRGRGKVPPRAHDFQQQSGVKSTVWMRW